MMFDKEIENKILILNERVIGFRNSGNYVRAVTSAKELRDLIRQRMGEAHPDYARSLNDLAGLYNSMGEVDDHLAVQFAKSLYIALLKNKMPIAEAFRCAREEIRKAKPFNSSWLAYVLYADPDAMMLDS